MKKYLILVSLITLPLVWSLFKAPFFVSHDADWMTIRLSAFHQSLRDGHFPVRWSSRLNHGYGYPVFNFVYPLPFYFGEMFYLISHSLTFSVKLVFASSLIVSALAMFFWLNHRFSSLAAAAGAVLYAYTPYRLVDVYVRGSIGESVAFMFPPLIFLGVDLLKKNPKLGICLGGLAAAATFLSHNAFVVFWPVALLYGLVRLKAKAFKHLIALFLLAALLSAYFWIPAVFELKFVYLPQLQVTQVTDHLLSVKQLVLPSWGYGPAVPGRLDSLSFQLGLVNLAVVVLASWQAIKQKLPTRDTFLLVMFVVSCLLVLKASRIIWQTVSLLSLIQFPWRLLSLAGFLSAALAAVVVNASSHKHLAIGLIILAVWLNLAYAHPQEYKAVDDSFYSTNESTTTIWNEYMPKWVKDLPQQRPQTPYQIISGKAQIDDFYQSNIRQSFIAHSQTGAKIQLASLYYPGWQALVNGELAPIQYAEHNGQITLDLPLGQSLVEIFWQETPLRKTANGLTLVSLAGLVAFSSLAVVKKKTSRI